MQKRNKLSLLLIAVIFLFLRFLHLEESLNFGTDQGIFFLKIYEIAQTKKITLIGPTASLSSSGRYAFLSSLMFYLLLPPLVLSRFDPLWASYFFILLQLITFLILYKTLTIIFKKNNISFYFCVIFITSEVVINYSRFLWNPNFMIPISSLVLTVLLYITKRPKRLYLLLTLLGLLFGLGLQFHYSFLATVLISLIWLAFDKKINLVNIVYLALGFTLGYLPLILFDLRHDFYNLRTILFILTSEGNTRESFSPQMHYILSLVPFIIFIFASIFSKIEKINRPLTYILLSIFIIFSLLKIIPTPSEGFTMAKGWNYSGLKKAEKIILNQPTENYNVIDILTGDTRAMALRALLTISGKPPLEIDQYPNSTTIFLYTKVPIEEIMKGSLWELDAAKPLKVVSSWPLQNGISLYMLSKISPNSY